MNFVSTIISDLFFTKGQLRLVGGHSHTEGRLEIFLHGRWGTVCDDSWGMPDARVACRQLGFPGVTSALVRFRGGTGPILMDNVACRGTESRLASCRHAGVGRHNCRHHEDVGLVCAFSSGGKIPLLLCGSLNCSLKYLCT